MTMNVDEEIERLKTEIRRLGTKQDDGSVMVKFGTLFHDDRCANIFEALVGTLRAAKKRKILTFDAEMLFQGVHDNVEIVLAKPKDVPAVDATVPVEPKKGDADVTTPVELKKDDKKPDVTPVGSGRGGANEKKNLLSKQAHNEVNWHHHDDRF